MQGSSSSRNNCRFEREVIICPRCNVEGIRKVSQSTTNPGRVYFKCANCDKFLGWADEVKQSMEGEILTDIAEVKKEVTELIVKMIEKGQSVIIMLLIAVIVVLTVMLV